MVKRAMGKAEPDTRQAQVPPTTLTDETFAEGLRFLAGCDADLAQILNEQGPPPMWPREPGFPTILHIILEQQVSLASARAAYDRLLAMVSPLTPERFLKLNDRVLKKIGFSRQKIAYGRNLAKAIVIGDLDLLKLTTMEDPVARSELMRIQGIGRWTADIYLLMALRRPDIWPSTDLALATALHWIKRLDARPMPKDLELIGDSWKPWRAVAARLLWHYYLSRRATRRA